MSTKKKKNKITSIQVSLDGASRQKKEYVDVKLSADDFDL